MSVVDCSTGNASSGVVTGCFSRSINISLLKINALLASSTSVSVDCLVCVVAIILQPTFLLNRLRDYI